MSGRPTTDDTVDRDSAFVGIDDATDEVLCRGLGLSDRREGKVRVSYRIDDERRVLITTDRISALDRVVGAVPDKGQILNQLTAWWCEQTSDIIANHLLDVPDPNAMIVRAATPLPVEVVVRGHLTGVTSTSMWTRYAAGQRLIDGHRLPDGLEKNTPLPTPLITPTTKAVAGAHDEPISAAEVVERGLVPAALWDEVSAAALGLFEYGTRRAAACGLVLVDTKYEFGLGADGELMLIDEVHTPDSSRLWIADSIEQRRSAGLEPESLDKEPTRRAAIGLADGASVPPDEIAATRCRYVEAYERLTGTGFEPGRRPVVDRLVDNLRAAIGGRTG